MNTDPSFHYILSLCIGLQLTDPRDRIFALLNISAETNNDSLAPDYNKSVEEVFIHTARHFVTRTQPNLSFLHSAGIGCDRKLTTLPSWVPDWSGSFPATSFGAVADGSGLLDKYYYACGEDYELMTIPVCSIRFSIHLRGRVLDAVKLCYDQRPVGEDRVGKVGTPDDHLRTLDWLIQLSHIFPDNFIYSNGAPFFPNVLSYTLVAGEGDQGPRSRDPVNPGFVDYFALQFLASKSLAEGRIGSIPNIVSERINLILSAAPASEEGEDWTSPLTIKNETLGKAYRSLESYEMRARRYRRFFVSEMDHVGLGPLLMREQDVICLLYGTSVPFLARRRVEGGYYLVGECYVHGLMHGEGMSMGSEEEIVLH